MKTSGHIFPLQPEEGPIQLSPHPENHISEQNGIKQVAKLE